MEKHITRRPLKDLRDFFDGNLVYLIAMLLLIIGSVTIKLTDVNFEISAIFVELLAIAIPAVIFANRRNRNPRRFLRINFLKPVDGLLVIGVFLTAYPVGVFLNYMVMIGLMRLGKVIPPDIPVPGDIGSFLLQLLSIAGSAALCEELLFRGFIMRAYEGMGWKKAIFISAGLFSALHLSAQNMAATFYLGLILGYVVYKTNSIFAGMLGHFLNNSIAIVLNATIRSIPGMSGADIKAAAQVMPTTGQMLLGAIFLGVFAVFMMAAQVGLLFILHERAFARTKEVDFIGPIHEAKRYGIRELWPLIPAFVIFLLFITMEILNLIFDNTIKLFS